MKDSAVMFTVRVILKAPLVGPASLAEGSLALMLTCGMISSLWMMVFGRNVGAS